MHSTPAHTTYASAAKANMHFCKLPTASPQHPSSLAHPLPRRPCPPTTSDSEKCLFIRLSAESPFRALHPHMLATHARQALPATIKIEAIQNTASGLAISPASTEDATELAKASNILTNAFQAISTEQADPWVQIVIPRTLYCI